MVSIDLLFGVAVLLLGIGGLARAVAIQMGYFKSVLLSVLERYTTALRLYNPLFQISLWFGVLLLGILMVAATFIELSTEAHIPMALSFLVAYFAISNGRWLQQHLPLLMPYPRWYKTLLERTTPEERRHIAYMWLHLPRRTRRLLSSHDRMFSTWADMVILAVSF
jgi:hypothetical protein